MRLYRRALKLWSDFCVHEIACHFRNIGIAYLLCLNARFYRFVNFSTVYNKYLQCFAISASAAMTKLQPTNF